MRKFLTAAAVAATMACAGQAAATTFLININATGPWFHSATTPYGLTDASTITGSFSVDTDLFTGGNGAEAITSFTMTAGSKTFTLGDLDLSKSSVTFFYEGPTDYHLVFGGPVESFIYANNTMSIHDPAGDYFACNGCITSTGFVEVPHIPEPATWAMMLLGFLGLGAVLRRSRRPFAVVA